MSEVTKDTVVSDQQESKKEVVSATAYEEVKQDMLKYKAKIAEYETEKESLKIKGMKEKEEWQKLATIREQEAEDLKKKLESQSKSTSNYFKRSEVRQQALKHGIRAEALDDIDLLSLDDVAIETTSTGKVNVLGADKFVDRLRATKPYWFENKSDPGVATTTPKATKPSSVSAKDVAKLYKDGKMAEYNEAMNKLRTKK